MFSFRHSTFTVTILQKSDVTATSFHPSVLSHCRFDIRKKLQPEENNAVVTFYKGSHNNWLWSCYN